MIFEKQWNALDQLDNFVRAVAVDTIENGRLTRRVQFTIYEKIVENGVTFHLPVPENGC
jgi:hypothetical protein